MIMVRHCSVYQRQDASGNPHRQGTVRPGPAEAMRSRSVPTPSHACSAAAPPQAEKDSDVPEAISGMMPP